MKPNTIQENVIADLSKHIQKEGASVAIIEGLSGVGKSFTAQKAAEAIGLEFKAVSDLDWRAEKIQGPFEALVLIDHESEDHEKIFELIKNFNERFRFVLVSDRPHFISDDCEELADSSKPFYEHDGARYRKFHVISISGEEIISFAKMIKPELTSRDEQLITKYSFGIPGLVKQMCRLPELSQDKAQFVLVSYLADTFACELRSRMLDRSPQTWMSKLLNQELPWEINKDLRDLRTFPHTLSKLVSIGLQNEEVEYPLPIVQKTMEIYEELAYNRPSAHICVAVPDLSEKDREALGFLDELRENREAGRAAQFRAWWEKSGFYSDTSSNGDMQKVKHAKRILKNLKAQGGAFGFSEHTNSLVFVSHTPHLRIISDNQIRWGYLLETYLQGEGIVYIVSYAGFLDSSLLFDPDKNEIVAIKGNIDRYDF